MILAREIPGEALRPVPFSARAGRSRWRWAGPAMAAAAIILAVAVLRQDRPGTGASPGDERFRDASPPVGLILSAAPADGGALLLTWRGGEVGESALVTLYAEDLAVLERIEVSSTSEYLLSSDGEAWYWSVSILQDGDAILRSPPSPLPGRP